MATNSRKSVIMGVVIIVLVIQQAQVEAKSCCCSISGRNCYNACRVTVASRKTCASLCGCKILDKCVSPCDRFNLYPEADEAEVIEYCKLGCMSSVCNTTNTCEQEKDVIENCTTGCDRVCTKDVEFAAAIA
ncbi:hypothetical protein CFC21_055814 [Triticum aestivum]|uniref:Uncharacterized protein n=2 Tax=Triticum aestivum TaxID=4565 RepID=A0A3B6I3X1_WHEAT|nr:hypothetical protein CFC21_055814 [Triticum aestivum]